MHPVLKFIMAGAVVMRKSIHQKSFAQRAEAIKAGNLEGITQRMENVMETVTEKKYPIISDIKDMMKEKGALNSIMSGSGPSIFGVYDKEADAQTAAEYIKQRLADKEIQAQIFVTEW